MKLQSRSVIQKGSKSFFWASLLFPRSIRQPCWDLYSWCRYCDDRIDQAHDSSQAKRAFNELLNLWLQSSGEGESLQTFQAVQRVRVTHQIPELHFLELLQGLAMDVQNRRYETLRELERYAYHVAGVVGIKMCYIMGVRDPRALSHAQDLGVAMQLTNIARDLKEDWSRGRLYVPLVWLRDENLDLDQIDFEIDAEVLEHCVQRLLDRADELYESGLRGLNYLPFRCSLAVAVAASLYQGIGRKMRRLGQQALSTRTVLSTLERSGAFVLGVIRNFRSHVQAQRSYSRWP